MSLSVSDQELLLSVTPYINALVAAYSLRFGCGTLVDQTSLNGREVRYWMTKTEEEDPEMVAQIAAKTKELRRLEALFCEYTELSPDSVVLVIRRLEDGGKAFSYEPKT